MSKSFNGRKMSHGPKRGKAPICPLCKSTMRRHLGVVSCTKMVGTRGGERRIVNHGSLKTIRKRMKEAA